MCGKRLTFLRCSPYEDVKYDVSGRQVKQLHFKKGLGKKYIHDYIHD